MRPPRTFVAAGDCTLATALAHTGTRLHPGPQFWTLVLSYVPDSSLLLNSDLQVLTNGAQRRAAGGSAQRGAV